LTATQGFVLTVDAPNEPPRLGDVPDRVAVVGQPFALTLGAVDPDQEPLAWSMSGLPATATLTLGVVYGTAVLAWTPSPVEVGQYQVTVKVADGGNGDPSRAESDTRTFRIVVRTQNTAPVFTPPTTVSVAEGNLLRLPLLATDPDGDSLAYSATNL